MNYVYHGAPDAMIGTELLPLNDMPDSMLEVRKLHLSKYEGREEILGRKIPLLDCLWNDVVQFLPFHPQKIFNLQKEMGLINEVPNYKFFEIDLSLLEPKNTVVFFKDAPGEENATVEWLIDVDFSKIQEVPKATIDYYKTLVGTGELPFNYQFVPHILHMGTVDVSHSKIITL